MYKLGFFTILLLACAANDNIAADNIQGNSVPLANVNIKSVAAKGVFLGLMNLSFNSMYLLKTVRIIKFRLINFSVSLIGFHYPILMPGNGKLILLNLLTETFLNYINLLLTFLVSLPMTVPVDFSGFVGNLMLS